MLAMGEFQVKSEETARSPEKCDLVGVDADDVISVAVMPVADPLPLSLASAVDITPSEGARDRILSLSWNGGFAWGTTSLSTASKLILAAEVSPVSR